MNDDTRISKAVAEMERTNEVYRAALTSKALAEGALTDATTALSVAASERRVAQCELTDAACSSPVTADFWASPLSA